MRIKPIRIFHLLLSILIVVFGAAFSASVDDDHVMIAFSCILFFPVLTVSLFCLFEPMKLFEYLFNNMVYFLQLLMLCAIESGSILNTMIYDHNIVLWVWIMSFILIVCLTQFFYFLRTTRQKPVNTA